MIASTVSRNLLALRALTALLMIALGGQLAWWTWHFITPSLKSVSFAAPIVAAPDITVGRQLFGDSTPETATASLRTDIRLKGVFAADGKTLSAAVLNLGGRDQAVKVGQELAAGVTLVAVNADFVVISRAGVRERIDLERFENRNAKQATASNAPAAQFRLNVAATGTNAYSLSRQELNSVLQDPRQQVFFNGRFGAATGGGVRVEDAPSGSLMEKLGIKTGDVITGVNGQPVNSQGDLVRLYQQFGTLSSIRAEVRRGGAPVMLSYTIQQ